MPQICLYAELLIHIRQLTLHAALQTVKNENTKILLSSDKKVITALHEGETASIYLPTQISGTANITFPLKKTTDLSTKLEIEDHHQLERAIEASSGVEVPWTASGFGQHVSLFCKECKSEVIEAGAIGEWKDLPSENWAELMDMWFCHKPHENHQDNTSAAEAKGFSAKSKLRIAKGVGYVDVLSFLVHPDDCTGLKVGLPRCFPHSIQNHGTKKEACHSHCERLLAGSLIQLPKIEFLLTQLKTQSTSFSVMVDLSLAEFLVSLFRLCSSKTQSSKGYLRDTYADISVGDGP